MRETWWIDARSRQTLSSRGLLSLAEATSAAGQVLSSDRQSLVLRLEGEPPLLLKWRRVARDRRRRTLFRPSRERREARAMLRGAGLGIACPRPLAVAERRAGPVLAASLLVRRFLEDHLPLSALGCDEALRDAVARAVRRWHDAGFRHGDCLSRNILASPDRTAFLPIGCPAARFVAPGPRFDRARRNDLAQLASGFLAGDGADAPLALLDAYAAEAPGLHAAALRGPVGARLQLLLERKERRRARRGSAPPAPLTEEERVSVRRERDMERLAGGR